MLCLKALSLTFFIAGKTNLLKELFLKTLVSVTETSIIDSRECKNSEFYDQPVGTVITATEDYS